ncbi:MAG: bifunctional adenosylcobinamide kinase/adenosylcobinamide-phosphate guanylyltransferase [Clostridia bacterium]|nr:bifunctional adenosylcobinamide kinase/adenosylcobinamide-phosphate guanylyltransferase [Clostridia bacterium]
MKLYIGGAYQGQEELAARENPGAEIISAFHERVREALANGEDPRAFAARICAEKPNAVVAANEVGAGIVPIDAGERAYREAVGRALCVIAQASDTVVRAVCGIGVRIK